MDLRAAVGCLCWGCVSHARDEVVEVVTDAVVYSGKQHRQLQQHIVAVVDV